MSEETTEQTSEVETTEAVEAPADETTETAPVEETDDSLKTRVGDEAYSEIQKLREEAKSYRLERDEYKSAFADLDPEGSKALLEAVKLITSDPKMAHEAFSELAEGLAEAAGVTKAAAVEMLEDVKEDAADSADDDSKPMTKADIDAYLAERETAAEKAKVEAAAEKSFNEEIAALGYKVDSEDLNEQLDTSALLLAASKHTNGDLNKAHEIVEARKQALIDGFLAQKADQGAAFAPSTSGNAGTSVPAKPQIKSVEDARIAASKLDA